MNKLLREVPSMESWISGGTSEFLQVSLHQDFIKTALDRLKVSVDKWLQEPIVFCETNIGWDDCCLIQNNLKIGVLVTSGGHIYDVKF